MVHDQDITAAQNVLARAPNGAGVNILVVPDSIGMGDNPAITIKLPLHVRNYKQQLRMPESVKYIHAGLLPNWDGLVGNIGVNTILVKEGVVQGRDTINRDQVIWHELGHVLLDSAETGRVYLHELTRMFNAHGAQATQNHVSGRRDQYAKVSESDADKAALRQLLQQTWNVII